MSSFSATLHLEGLVLPVLMCSQHAHQPSDAKGRPTAQAAGGELQVHLALGPGILLPSWAYQPTKALNGHIHFAPADGVSPGINLIFEEGYCVSYEEHFEPGQLGQPAFHCRLSIVARRIVKQGVVYESTWPAF